MQLCTALRTLVEWYGYAVSPPLATFTVEEGACIAQVRAIHRQTRTQGNLMSASTKSAYIFLALGPARSAFLKRCESLRACIAQRSAESTASGRTSGWQHGLQNAVAHVKCPSLTRQKQMYSALLNEKANAPLYRSCSPC
jgi:hypothetical protein